MKEIKLTVAQEYLNTVKQDFGKYKSLGDKTFNQLEEKDFHYKTDDEENSIAILIQHLSGNLISRFTDFLTSDGEKPDRNRDAEFDDKNISRNELIEKWETGWKVLNNVLVNLKEEDLLRTVYIRNEPHSVIEALNRQATHYAYHVGQIVLLAKQIKKENWHTLSISRGKSEEFNKKMFSQNIKPVQ